MIHCVDKSMHRKCYPTCVNHGKRLRRFIGYISSGCFLSDNIKIKIRINTMPTTCID